MSTDTPRSDRWQHLVHGAFLLEERSREAPGSAQANAAQFLESVLEVFPSRLDPLDDFEAYAVRRAALALLNALRAHEPP